MLAHKISTRTFSGTFPRKINNTRTYFTFVFIVIIIVVVIVVVVVVVVV